MYIAPIENFPQISGIAPVSKPVEPVSAPVMPQSGSVPAALEYGVVLQFTAGDVGKSGFYNADGRPVEDSIAMGKSRMKSEPGQCQTCAERRYQDGSNDSSVSFQTPTNVAPEAAASLVRAHEQEHVSNESAKAREKGLNAMSTVAIHTDICPECKKVYVSGGTTYTQFTANPEKVVDAYAEQMGKTVSMLLKGA
ncbi:MAG: hypothetical protein FWG36_02400 [Oscillospiraceae bacterium]|nr:hypothetical protein [Oscillospiraceae bacterium]